MEALGITVGDLAVVGILIIAGLMGLALGLVKAILFVGCWIGAGLATLYGFERVKPYFHDFIENQLYADIAAAATLFLICLIVLFWIGSRIWSWVRNSSFNGLDRSLGLLGGLFVGAVLISLAYLGATWMWGEKDMPQIIAEARARPYVRSGADFLRTFIPETNRKEAETAVDSTHKRVQQAIETEKAMRKLFGDSPAGKGQGEEGEKGYAEPSRRDMDRLIDSKQ